MLELDHFFICTRSAADAAASLLAAGLAHGFPRPHVGQGTTGTFSFFDNAYLEVLDVHEDEETRSEAIRPTGLWARADWRENGACPFGVAFRGGAGAAAPEDGVTWKYHPPYMPEGRHIAVFTPEGALKDPFVFISPGSAPPSKRTGDQVRPLEHFGRRWRVERLSLRVPEPEALSSGVRAFLSVHGIGVLKGPYRMDLQLGGGTAGERKDFNPALPLTLALG